MFQVPKQRGNNRYYLAGAGCGTELQVAHLGGVCRDRGRVTPAAVCTPEQAWGAGVACAPWICV